VKENLRQWWAGLQPRERLILALGAGVVTITFVYLLLDPLFRGVSARAQRVAEKEALLADVQRSAARLPRAGGVNKPDAGGTAPVIIANRTIQAAGLGNYLKQAQPSGEGDGVRVQFEDVPFDTMVLWLSQIATQHGMRIDSAQLDAGNRPGTADARLSLQGGST
jgi:general secretion pathway protein M